MSSVSKRAVKIAIPVFLVVILGVSIFSVQLFYSNATPAKADPGVYVGIAYGGDTIEDAKTLIDRVEGYTNLFILDSGRNALSRNETNVEEVCDYAVANGLSIIVNLGIDVVDNKSESTWFWQQPINETIERWNHRWGGKFLGIYYNDEPGGIQLDGDWANWFRLINGENLNKIGWETTDLLYQIYQKMKDTMINGTLPQNYDLEANFFVNGVLKSDPGFVELSNAGITTFTSDYGLYWWDYLGGYNVMFTELGWNASVAEQIALVKGAARMQNKDWGAMITWKYDSLPYLDEGYQIYNQMMAAYQAGAKFITVFNYPYEDGNYGTLGNDQFFYLYRFWNDITTQKFPDLSGPNAALVLPKNFGWGMRHPNDTIWGFWTTTTDSRTIQVAMITSMLLDYYGTQLDIIYQDNTFPVANVGYRHIYYWNSTAL